MANPFQSSVLPEKPPWTGEPGGLQPRNKETRLEGLEMHELENH